MAESRAEQPTLVEMRGRCARIARFCVIAFALVVCVSAQGQVACRYEVSAVIQAPPGGLGAASATSAAAISPNGRYVVGNYTRPFIVDDPRAFCYDMQTGQFISLPLPANGWQSFANDVSDSGIVVGSYWVTGGVMPQRGYVFDLSSSSYIAELLPHPGASWCAVTGINASGAVCGTRSIGSKGDPVNPQTAFIWSAKSGFTDLGLVNDQPTGATDISNDGFVTTYRALGQGAMRWSPPNLLHIPAINQGAGAIAVVDVIVGGDMVGGAQFLSGSTLYNVPFEFRNGLLRVLPFPSAELGSCNTTAMNSSGLMLGRCNTVGGSVSSWRPYLWYGNQVVSVGSLMSPESAILLRSPVGMSEDGTILTNASPSAVWVLAPHHRLPGDVTCDDVIDGDDLLAVIGAWGISQSPSDLNGDGTVGVPDLLAVIVNWSVA